MSSPAWNRRRNRQRQLARVRKIRRTMRVLHIKFAHHRHVHIVVPSYHAHGLAIDVNRPS